MQIITNGDFIFPTKAAEYIRDQLYVWAYSKGTPNLDEVIRLLTHLPMLVVFVLFGQASNNLVVSYFYLALVTVSSLGVGYYFLRQFLGVSNRAICLVLAVFYTFNPIFLGNYSKVGLVLATNMLPLLLTLLKRFHQTRRFSFILGAIIALNVSFIHPFNLTFNAMCVVGYLIFLVWRDKRFIKQTYRQMLTGMICCLLINAFMILPILSLGTVSKSALSQNISDPTLMSANLVEIANTGNIFTAFSLSKNIFLDYNFYDKAYQVLYYLGALLLYILLLGLFVHVNHRLSPPQKKQITLCMLGLLCLLVVSTGTFLGIDKLLTFAIGLPGGWAFRSPLKWQFYMPLLLITMFAIVLVKVPQAKWRRLSLAALMGLMVLLSGYIGHDIVGRLLKPKNIDHLYILSQKTPEYGRVLLVRDDKCIEYFNRNGSLANKINAIYYEKSIQVKEISPEYLDTINAANYDQILACKPVPLLARYGLFTAPQPLATGEAAFYSYYNQQPRGPAYATLPVRSPQAKLTNVSGKFEFLRGQIGQTFDLVDDQQPLATDWAVIDAFETMTTADIKDRTIRKTFRLDHHDHRRQTSFYNHSGQPIYYQYDAPAHVIKLSAQPQPDYLSLDAQPLHLGQFNGDLTVWYQDQDYDFANLISNGSFEQGMWKAKVDDCFNYDSTPVIGMKLNNQHWTDGRQSLELSAARHLACTHPPQVKVSPLQQYMLGIDYRTSRRDIARYGTSFDDEAKTSLAKRLEPTNYTWQTYNSIIEPPEGAKRLKLTLFGVPSNGTPSATLYDNLKLVRVPKIAGQFFVLQQPTTPAPSLPKISAQRQNPTQIRLTAQAAKQPFHVVLNDSYHRGWQLQAAGQALPHAAVNGHENIWFVDTPKLCAQTKTCHQPNSLWLTARFTPQRLYNLGLLISSVALLGTTSYIIWDYRQHRRVGRSRRHRRQAAPSARRLHNV